jgi:hypothetical protein
LTSINLAHSGCTDALEKLRVSAREKFAQGAHNDKNQNLNGLRLDNLGLVDVKVHKVYHFVALGGICGV